MKTFFRNLSTLLLFIFSVSVAQAVTVRGRVVDSSNLPMPFASVFIKGTTNGTTTNQEGYYKLELQPGNYTIVYKYIGYKQVEKTVVVASQIIELNVTLEVENYKLSEAVVKAGDEDPAYRIIRKAIEKRKFYRDQVEEYSCDVYIKGWQRLTKYPKKIFGQKVDLTEIIDSTTGVVYLSESMTKFNFRQPDDVKEIMISSKVSGSNKAFSFNRASDMVFNFYENLIAGVSPRGFVSPIANNGLFFYKYKLIGTYLENGITVNKIEVIPKRKNDPVFRGYIFIQEDTWRIHSTDLYLTKDAQLQFVDTLRIDQQMLPVEGEPDIWLPVSNKYIFSFSFLGFEGDGIYMGVLSNYNVHPNFPKGFFNGEVIRIEEGSNKKDSSYWNSVRPVPLTAIEQNDYIKKDSLEIIHESKPYLDSVDRKNNKVKIGALFMSGYNYKNSFKKSNLHFSSLIELVNFNTVEGWNFNVGADYSKRFEKSKRLNSSLNMRYGLSGKQFYGDGSVAYLHNIRKSAQVTVYGGHTAVQYNENTPITPFLNTWYSLAVIKNYMKIYEKDFVRLQYRYEILNGLMMYAITEYADRTALVNTTDFTFKKTGDRVYTSNNPQQAMNDAPAFENYQSFFVNVNFRIRFKQKYYNDPEAHYIIGSKYPALFVRYKKGIKGVFGSDVDYDHFNVGLEDHYNFGLLGRLNYYGAYGNFLSKKSLYFVDQKHFNGNLTAFSQFRLNDFNQLSYYNYSTTGEYYEIHASHDFNGFFFNKIPLLRKAKLNEVVSAHYLHTFDGDHFEFGIGVDKFGAFRIDFVSAVAKGSKPVIGFRLGTRFVGLID